MDKERILGVIEKYPVAFKNALGFYNAIQPANQIRKKGVIVKTGISIINGLKISCKGENNSIIIEDYVRVNSCKISISGNDNKIIIKKNSVINWVEFAIENDGNLIQIGEHSALLGKTQLAAIEGTKITIGDNCLFSEELHFRTGDSHSIINNDGRRINQSKDIIIGNHVWFGTRVICLKGVTVLDDSVVAAGSVLCKQYDEPNCIIAGVPGRIIRQNINWTNERIPMEVWQNTDTSEDLNLPM